MSDDEVSSEGSMECEDVRIEYEPKSTQKQYPVPSEKKPTQKKPKGIVELRSSKGRVLRYLRLPKAVDFMSPDTTEYFTESQRQNLFNQLKAQKD